jgi:hypothetical protein
VPWRLASLAIPVGIIGGGLLSGLLSILPRWGEVAIWLGGSMYGILLLLGYRTRQLWGDEGPRW